MQQQPSGNRGHETLKTAAPDTNFVLPVLPDGSQRRQTGGGSTGARVPRPPTFGNRFQSVIYWVMGEPRRLAAPILVGALFVMTAL